MATKCLANPPSPEGFKIWRGAAPDTALVQWAVDLRDHWMMTAKYGDAQTLDYDGSIVLARKDHHTWTYKKGVLVTGICIPGITLYKPLSASIVGLSIGDDTLETPTRRPRSTRSTRARTGASWAGARRQSWGSSGRSGRGSTSRASGSLP